MVSVIVQTINEIMENVTLQEKSMNSFFNKKSQKNK